MILTLFTGTINLPALVVGTITGSYIIKRWKLEIIGITRLSLVSIIGSMMLSAPAMFIGCDTTDIAGLNVPYPERLKL